MADDDDKTFSQDDVTAAATRASKEAERKTRQRVEAELAETLGCTVEEAKAKLAAAEKADEATKTEAERKLAEAEKREQAAVERESKADQRIAEANARAALAAEGLPKESMADAVALLKVEASDEDDDIAEKVEALKTRLPALFTSTGDGETPPPGVPPVKQKKASGGKTPAERAKERFAATQTPLAKTA